MTTPCHCFPSVRGGRNRGSGLGPDALSDVHRWAERHGFTYTILDYQDGDEHGIKSAAIRIEGDNAYGYLKVSMAFTGWCGYPPLTPMPGGRILGCGGDHPGAGRQRGGRYTP